MNRSLAVAACLILASLPACGPAAPAQSPEPAGDGHAADAPAAPAADAPAAKPAPAAEPSPAEALARDLVKAGGRRIAYSATKKRFLVPIEMRADGGRGLDLHSYDEEGQDREIEHVCQPGECEERLDELIKELVPKLAAKLEKDGYEAVSALGWPSGRDELEVGTLGGKLRYGRGQLSLVREKKPAASLHAQGGRGPKAAALSAVYPVSAAKVLGAFAEGERVVQEFYVFKLP